LRIHTNDSRNRRRSTILFLKLKSRDTLLVGEKEICKALSFVGGAMDSLAPTIFQMANVDTGEIKFVHGEKVRKIVCS
tara:strand:+ start:157 stop:390 length:234 start_codon:yes stop_codon:yes gene_type:complete